MDWISDAERLRIAEVLAEGTLAWRLHEEINRSRYVIWRAVVALHRAAQREPRRPRGRPDAPAGSPAPGA